MDNTEYISVKNALLKKIAVNTSHEIEYQEDQVVVWLESFKKKWSICYQNGDMNGKYRGQGVWWNPGANSGIESMIDILAEIDEFKTLIDNDSYFKYGFIRELVHEYCGLVCEEYKIDQYFDEN